jgi:hypothetical protein
MASRKSAAKSPDEGAVISAITKAFVGVDDPASRQRILRWAISAYGGGMRSEGERLGGDDERQQEKGHGGKNVTPSADLGELIEQADPQNVDDRVLVVCYWLQENESPEGFAAQPVNNKMKDMGHKVSNITDKLSQLIAKKPAWIRQVSKSGKQRQARKKYKLTDAGKSRVASLLRGEATTETTE